MNIGMLWFDDSSVTLPEKIERAVSFYTEKYGREPTLCLVNPKTINGGEATLAGVEVRKARCVMPDHFWIGIGEQVRQARPERRKAA